jgi:glucosyl-3-phosphoglycerate phosphatase
MHDDAGHGTARLLLIRHGQSTWNAEGRWQGHSDPPLSPLGERQAKAAGATVLSLGVDAVVSSDLARARRTAELLAPAGIEPVVEAALKERNVGAWEGLTADEIDARFPGMRAAHHSPPGFESDESVARRVVPALLLVARRLGDGGVAVVVSHGGVIRTLERHLGAPAAPVPNLAGRWLLVTPATTPTTAVVDLGDREVLIDPDDATLTIPTEE